jgi:hypothetical protein
MKKLVDDFIELNTTGRVLELCEKYYDDNVLMLSNGDVFAKTMREAYNKQKGFVESVKAFDVKLVESSIDGNQSELTFHYKMTAADSSISEFTGKHIQTWENDKIIKEEYVSV